MNRLKQLFIITIFLVVFSCDFMSSDAVEDNFFIQRDESIMPVWVRGNPESDKILIILHGGPGGSSYHYLMQELFTPIENKYIVAYYDQRASGQSQGNTDPSSLTLDNFSEDVDLLVDTLKTIYNPEDIYILAHSWGGFLGAYYLLDPAHQEKISGWIEEDGAHNSVESVKHSRNWVINYATDRVNQGDENYQELLNWYSLNTEITESNYKQHIRYVKKCNGYYYNSDYKFPENQRDTEYFSQFSHWLNLAETNGNSDLLRARKNTSLSSEMYKITIPSLIIWGAHDGVIPMQMATDAYESLGTDPQFKEKVIFQKSGHSPHYEENEKFNQTVISFMEKY